MHLFVLVVGSGVIGLSTAIKVYEEFNPLNISVDVEIISEEFSPNTTSDIAVCGLRFSVHLSDLTLCPGRFIYTN